MPESNWSRHAIRVGVFEFRRTVRAVREDTARAFLLALGLVFPSVVPVVVVYFFAGAIRDAGAVSLPPVARGTVALFWLFGVFISTQRVVSARPRIDGEPLMLATVSARTVVWGLLVAETLRVLAYLGLPVLVVTGSVAYLYGSVASLLLVPLAVVCFGFTVVLVGSILGYAIALLVATSPFVARHKTILGGVAALLAVGGYMLMMLPKVGGVGQAELSILPLGWFVDLAVLGTPVRGSTNRALVAVVGSLLVTLVGSVVVERAAKRLWYTDPVTGERAEPDTTVPTSAGGAERTALADAVAPLRVTQRVSTPTRRVAQWSVLRTRRDPRRLNFLLLPVAMVGSALVGPGLQATSPSSVLAPAAAVLLPWMAGATFAMNPFGDEGAVLSVTLTATSGTAYVRGVMLPGLSFGLPLAVLVTGGAAIVGPFEPPVAAGLVAVSVLATVVAVTTAPAVGMWFPRFSAISIGQSREVLPPRLGTTALHFLGITIPGAFLTLLLFDPRLARTVVAGIAGFLPAALVGLVAGGGVLSGVATWFRSIGTAVQSVGVESFQLAAGTVLVVGALVAAAASYRFAVRRFERYSPPL